MDRLLSLVGESIDSSRPLRTVLDGISARLLSQHVAVAAGCGMDNTFCYEQCENCYCNAGPCFGFNCVLNNWSPSISACNQGIISRLTWNGSCC